MSVEAIISFHAKVKVFLKDVWENGGDWDPWLFLPLSKVFLLEYVKRNSEVSRLRFG